MKKVEYFKTALVAFVAIVASLFAVPAMAVSPGLTLNITDAGSGNTRWQFFGSTTALVSDTSINSFWGNAFTPGNPANSNVHSVSILSGGGELFSTSQGTKAVADVWVQSSSQTIASPRVAYPFGWNAGDVLSWTGDLIAAVSISAFNPGTYTTTRLYSLDNAIAQPLTVNIGSTNVVPVPAALPLLAAGLGGLAVFARRRRAA